MDEFAKTAWSFSFAAGVNFSHGIEVSATSLAEIFFVGAVAVFPSMFFSADGFVSAQIKEQLNSRQIPKVGINVSLRRVECLGMFCELFYGDTSFSSSVFTTD